MKKALALAALLAVVVSVVVVAAPQEIPGGGWWSGEQVQNVGNDEATVSVVAYDASSAATFEVAPTKLDVGASVTFLPGDFANMPDGFQGSAIVSSDQDIRAIVNVTNRDVPALGLGIAGGLAAGQYQGINTPATSVNFPLVKLNYFNKTTTFYIQNAGNDSADITAVFTMGDGNEYSFTAQNVGVGQMVVINPADAEGADGAGVPSGNTTDAVGSLTVTSEQLLAGVVKEHGYENPAIILQSTRGFAPEDGDTTAYAPIIKHNFFNRFTGLQVQNVSDGPVDITVTYAGSGACNETDTATGVAPGASHTFVHLGAQTNLPDNCLASATIVATGDIVAIVNESYTPAAVQGGLRQESTTFSAIPANAATPRISIPLFKEDSFNKGTGVQVQNVGDGTAEVVLTFSGPAGTFTTNPIEISAGAGHTFVDVRKLGADFWGADAMTPEALGCDANGNNCGANGVFGITITADENIVAIANESTYPFVGPRMDQDKSNYEGFNLAP